MRVRLLWPGRTKERWIGEGIAKFEAMIKPFAKIEIKEVRDSGGGTPEALKKEGDALLKASEGGYILLDERGAQMGSVEFAAMLKDRAKVEFVIGGAYGVSDDVRAAASASVAISKMTLTHEMARLLLMEQIYRAIMINTGRGYHH